MRGDTHTNTIEGYFSIFKRGMKGVYQHCGEAHLHRYLAEFDSSPFGQDGGPVEVDETFIGRKTGVKVGAGYEHKRKVLALVDRSTGRSRAMVVDKLSIKALTPILQANIAKEAHVMTDQAGYYRHLHPTPYPSPSRGGNGSIAIHPGCDALFAQRISLSAHAGLLFEFLKPGIHSVEPRFNAFDASKRVALVSAQGDACMKGNLHKVGAERLRQRGNLQRRGCAAIGEDRPQVLVPQAGDGGKPRAVKAART